LYSLRSFAAKNGGVRALCHMTGRPEAILGARESAHQQKGESPFRTEHWLSVAGGNCVAENRRGGEQPEANCQSISTR